VFPFSKLPNVDTLLGPEMKSTGEVMGVADNMGMAFAKAQIGADGALPLMGSVFVTVHDRDKPTVFPIVQRFQQMGFKILATSGTADYLSSRGIPVESVLNVWERRPNAADLIVSGAVQLLINTPLGKLTARDDYLIRRAALQHRVPYTTTMSAAAAACEAVAALRRSERTVRSLQEWYELVTPEPRRSPKKAAAVDGATG
jgi:carbamoyl-phosphate synthase large subunit